ncbi:MAG: lysophospholipase [Clostridiales bacterium]|nr:lysophospholipase [Clostridiales bacterium]
MHLEGHLKSFDGTDLYYVKDMPEQSNALVIVIHGLCEHLGRYGYLTDKLTDKNFGVYRFDNRGHGKSGGKRGYVDDFNDFILDADKVVELARTEYPKLPVFMFGHSMGGFITAAYGAKYSDKLTGQVLSGAAVTDLPAFSELKSTRIFERDPEYKIPNTLSPLISRDKSVVEAYDSDPLVLKEITAKLAGEVFVNGIDWLSKNITSYKYPCLILHGKNDQIVLNQASIWMYENISSKDKEIKLYKDCFHEILNEKDEKDTVIADIINWLNKRI